MEHAPVALSAVAQFSVAPLLSSCPGATSPLSVADIELTPAGDAVVSLSNNFGYVYSASADAWIRVADASFVGSHYFASSIGFARNSLPSGPLAAAQLTLLPRLSYNVAPFLASLSSEEQKLITIAYLESQRSAALALGSENEHTHWTIEYVKRL